MDCPKCGFALDATAIDCPRCGIVIAKFLRARERADAKVPPSLGDTDSLAIPSVTEDPLPSERKARLIALPLGLLFAWLAVKGSPGAVRMLGMWVHESGHAVTAWMCGYAAWPGPWFTPIGTERSPMLSLLIVGLLAYGGYRAWQLQRWFWVSASAGGMLLVLLCTLRLNPSTAQQFIIFGGDGGSLVLGTMLMLTVYAREDHPIRRNHLRWGFLVIGALAFMDVFAVWTGPADRLPFGENENGLSDPSVLTEQYGWTLVKLVHSYSQLARVCLALLAVVYVTELYFQFVSTSASTRAGSGTTPERAR